MHLLPSPTQRSRVLDRFITQSQAFFQAVGTKFLRQGKWGPWQVFLTLCMSHSEASSKAGLSWEDAIGRVHASPAGEAFGWGDDTSPPTTRSFYDARLKLNKYDDRFIWNHLLETMADHDSRHAIWLGGFRFLHGDGMQFHVSRSEETLKEFSVQDNGKCKKTHYPQGKLVALIEGGSGRMIDFQLVRCKDKKRADQSSILFEEKEAIRHFVGEMKPNDCLVWDSGGSSQKLFHEMNSAGKHFIMAINSGWLLARKFKASGKDDLVIDHHVQKKFLPEVAENKRNIKLRLVRIRDKEGASKTIATNILGKLTRSQIRKIYKQRWAVETLFRHAKEYLGMRILRSKTLLGIKQEVLAVLAILHLAAHIQDGITGKANAVKSPLCCLKAGFRRPRTVHLINFSINLLATVCARNSTRLDRSTRVTWSTVLANPYIVEPGRSLERISRLPFALFKVMRKSRGQRKAKIKAVI